jgi:hypothetical protein
MIEVTDQSNFISDPYSRKQIDLYQQNDILIPERY